MGRHSLSEAMEIQRQQQQQPYGELLLDTQDSEQKVACRSMRTSPLSYFCDGRRFRKKVCGMSILLYTPLGINKFSIQLYLLTAT